MKSSIKVPGDPSLNPLEALKAFKGSFAGQSVLHGRPLKGFFEGPIKPFGGYTRRFRVRCEVLNWSSGRSHIEPSSSKPSMFLRWAKSPALSSLIRVLWRSLQASRVSIGWIFDPGPTWPFGWALVVYVLFRSIPNFFSGRSIEIFWHLRQSRKGARGSYKIGFDVLGNIGQTRRWVKAYSKNKWVKIRPIIIIFKDLS